VSVKANLIGRDQGSFVAEAQRKVADRVRLPPGYSLTWGGQFENQQRAMKRQQYVTERRSIQKTPLRHRSLGAVTVFFFFFFFFWRGGGGGGGEREGEGKAEAA
jgi:hypothetical protein